MVMNEIVVSDYSIGTPKQGDQFQGVSAIVLDEVHYLSDTSRGTVWEETVCSLNPYILDGVVICLHA